MKPRYQNLIERIRNELSDLEQVIERAQEGWTNIQDTSAKERQAFVDSVLSGTENWWNRWHRIFPTADPR